MAFTRANLIRLTRGNKYATPEPEPEPSSPVVTGTAPNAVVGMAYVFEPGISGGTGPYVWALSEKVNADDYSINAATGKVTGTPSGTGPVSFTITATDANSKTGSLPVSFTVMPVPLPASLTVAFGANTRAGHGAADLQYLGTDPLYITSGDTGGDFAIGGDNKLLPAGTYGTATSLDPEGYTLNISDGVYTCTVTVNILPDVFTVAPVAAGSQIADLIGASSAKVNYGDTIQLRPGKYTGTTGIRPKVAFADANSIGAPATVDDPGVVTIEPEGDTSSVALEYTYIDGQDWLSHGIVFRKMRFHAPGRLDSNSKGWWGLVEFRNQSPSNHVWFDECEFSSEIPAGCVYQGVGDANLAGTLPNGLIAKRAAGGWGDSLVGIRVTDCLFYTLEYGITGGGAMDMVIDRNMFRKCHADCIQMFTLASAPHKASYSYNVMLDRVWSSASSHPDHIQMIYAGVPDAECYGPDIIGNLMVRGDGTPGMSSGQGIFTNPAAGYTMPSNFLLLGDVKNNLYVGDAARAISLYRYKGVLENNTTVGDPNGSGLVGNSANIQLDECEDMIVTNNFVRSTTEVADAGIEVTNSTNITLVGNMGHTDANRATIFPNYDWTPTTAAEIKTAWTPDKSSIGYDTDHYIGALDGDEGDGYNKYTNATPEPEMLPVLDYDLLDGFNEAAPASAFLLTDTGKMVITADSSARHIEGDYGANFVTKTSNNTLSRWERSTYNLPSHDFGDYELLAVHIDQGQQAAAGVLQQLKFGARKFGEQAKNVNLDGALFNVSHNGAVWATARPDATLVGYGEDDFKTTFKLLPMWSGYADVTLDAYIGVKPGAALDTRKPTLILTLDDNNDSQYTNRALYLDRGIPATFYVPTHLVGVPGKMTALQLAELQAAGCALALDSGPLDEPVTRNVESLAEAIQRLEDMRLDLSGSFSDGPLALQHLCLGDGLYGLRDNTDGSSNGTVSGGDLYRADFSGNMRKAYPTCTVKSDAFTDGSGYGKVVKYSISGGNVYVIFDKAMNTGTYSFEFLGRVSNKSVVCDGTATVTPNDPSWLTLIRPGWTVTGYSVPPGTVVDSVNTGAGTFTANNNIPATCPAVHVDDLDCDFHPDNVTEALLNAGFKSARSTNQGSQFASSLFPPDPRSLMGMRAVSLLDNNAAAVLSSIDSAIAGYGDIILYGHQLDISTGPKETNWNTLFQGIKDRVDAGDIQCLNISDWWALTQRRPAFGV